MIKDYIILKEQIMTDTLFEQHTIKEIQDIEKNLRNDIERKKEELRQMVGERYRDLMEAADTITEMKDIAENINFRINSIETQFNQLQCTDWQSNIIQSVNVKVAERKKKNEDLYTVTCLIKILMDAPAKIWAFIENEDFLNALQVFLLARHTHSILVLDPLYNKRNVLPNFPIISKQWTSIRHFQYTILQKSREILLSPKLQAEAVVGPLCCITFLSDASLEQVFEDVLSARKVAILSIFKPEKSAKSQICELIGAIQNALKTVYTLFYPESPENSNDRTNLIVHTIQRIISHNEPGPMQLLDLQASLMIQYLPKDISTFRPTLKSSAEGIASNNLQNSCKNWIQGLKSELNKILKDLLDFVATSKGLAMIREAVVSQLSEISSWDVICSHLLGNEMFSIWDFFLKERFMKRINVIICNKIETAKNICSRETEKAFNEFHNASSQVVDENMSSYIWRESEGDLGPNLGWIPHHQKPLWNSGTLGMKSYGLTPKVQNICSMLDKKLENLLDDVSHFTKRKDDSEWCVEKTSFPTPNTREAADVFVDLKEIHSCLTTVAKKTFSDLTSYLKQLLHTLEKEVENGSPETSSKIVFIGHLCSGLTKLCPYLIKCLLLENNENLSMSPAILFANAAKDDQSWLNLKNTLSELSDDAFRMWSLINISALVEKFDSEFVVCSGGGILKLLLQWDKVEIQEESEEGTAVKSVLRIPQQVSVPLFSCLYKFCWALNKIGGHALSSKLRGEIREEFLFRLLTIYQKKTNEDWPRDVFCSHLGQTQSLQLLFDIQFLMGLMSPKEHSSSKVSLLAKETIEKVVSYIDPFDMDVFSTHLQNNLRKGLQKSVLLLGLITSPEQITHLSGMKSLPSTQMDHNLMLTPCVSSRLPLLPCTTRSNSAATTTISESASNISLSAQASPLKSSRSHSSSPNLNVSENFANVLKSSSFYDRVTAMSSSWFGS